jgi:hypothetical protein
MAVAAQAQVAVVTVGEVTINRGEALVVEEEGNGGGKTT